MRQSQLRTWLRPGMSVKRWSLLLGVGVVLFCLSLSMGIAWAYRSFTMPEWFTHLLTLGTWQAMPHPWREIVLFVAGATVVVVAIWRMSQSLISPLLALGKPGASFTQIVAEHRFGPTRPDLRVVVLGGGTGLSTALRGLKQSDVDLTAIVTVTDDGGSTGRLRRDFNVPAPGDIRNCIVALADAESTVGQLFGYRFEQSGSPLDGHSLGNLFITALAQETGSFEQAVIESGRVLAIHGRVLPTTLEDVSLVAQLDDGSIVAGETTIGSSTQRIRRVMIEPAAPPAYQPALDAILDADLIVLGPGSLFTSVLPNLMVRGVREALRQSRARVAYVCNVANQPGETDAFSVEDHIAAVVDHLGPGLLDVAIVNDATELAAGNSAPLRVVSRIRGGMAVRGVNVVYRPVVDAADPLRHDPDRLASALLEVGRAHVAQRSARRTHTSRKSA